MIEENPFSENSNEFTEQRPTFLSVLCVLTFIGSGISSLLDLFSFFFSDLIFNSSINSSGYYENYIYNEKWMYLVDFSLSITSIIGAIFMFNLRKKGFYIYLISNIILIFTPSFLTLNMNIDFLGLMFVTAPFIILYGLHLKHMN